ncbi:hypothetical protein [Nostoc flagelliforme]|nr:hypothetical protein [Nostoc flagelliforme]
MPLAKRLKRGMGAMSLTLLWKNLGGKYDYSVKSNQPPHPCQILKNGHMRRLLLLSNMRPVRREKLNRAANSGDNPGFDFLQECWNDDPALQIVIKKLLVKFPQWGIAIVDGVLVN